MVERLAAIHNDLGVHNDAVKADAEYAAAFRAYGVDLDRMEPEPAGRRWRPARQSRTWPVPSITGRSCGAGRRCGTRSAGGGWSRPRGRPIPTRGGVGSATRSCRMGGDAARKLEVLERLAATADVDHLPAASVTRLAAALAFLGRRDTAIALLADCPVVAPRRLLGQRRPRRELLASGRPEQAIRFFAVAAGVSPRSELALTGLGKALLQNGQPSEAVDVLREATRLRPDDALVHVALGAALLMCGEPHAADSEFSEARRLQPEDWGVRDQIGIVHSDRGDWGAAVEEQQESVRRFPGLAVGHKALAHALEGAGRLDDAIAEFRAAVRLEARFPSAYLYLGRALIEAGDYRAALDALAHVDPGPPPADPKISAATLASRAKHLIALEPRLHAVLKGRDLPADAETVAEFARLAFSRSLHAAAAHLWSTAFAASPALATDPTTANRFQAARAAALAGAEGGRLGGAPEAGSRAHWREPGRGLAGSRPRHLCRWPAIGVFPAASRGHEAARPVAGRPRPGRTPRSAGPDRTPRARAPFARRPLAPDRRVAREGRRTHPARTRPGQKPVTAPVTSGDIFPISIRGKQRQHFLPVSRVTRRF